MTHSSDHSRESSTLVDPVDSPVPVEPDPQEEVLDAGPITQTDAAVTIDESAGLQTEADGD